MSTQVTSFIKDVIQNMPSDWLSLTTHRLDIYDESRAKTQFLEEFEILYAKNNSNTLALEQLPTAYDYIRLGHPLSTVMEWIIAKLDNLSADSVISFSSKTIPALAILRTNLLANKTTKIFHKGTLPKEFDAEILRKVYGYQFDVQEIENTTDITPFDGSTVLFTENENVGHFQESLSYGIDFWINHHSQFGSVMLVNGEKNKSYISDIQHLRRRETIAMTPANCLAALHKLLDTGANTPLEIDRAANAEKVQNEIHAITATKGKTLVASSGLSMQYALMMGLIEDAMDQHPEKDIKFIVPPNCYGGTNDQARRVAACLTNVEVLDLPVDGEHNMVQSIDVVLDKVAQQNALAYIITEIPTNPRVEVPNLDDLKAVLSKQRTTADNAVAVDPVFIIDQTFCPNVQFLSEQSILANIRTISYVSGSKFPSGGKCTAGYCAANSQAENLMPSIEKHLVLCDNEATDLQLFLLAEQMPSMNQRIADAYLNTRDFVNFIEKTLPDAKINFVPEELTQLGFTPSVFSLDLPTKGATPQERETYKRALNDKLIDMMISEIPDESKYCVSYGQLKGCYWTIPATSTQGTTKEADKDYIARVSVSANLDLEKHKAVFQRFVSEI